MRKRLLIARHAKSSWTDPDLADHDRPLNARGRRASTAMGRHLREAGLVPDLVLCSSASRARETLARFELPTAIDVRVEDPLYGADAGSLLDRLRTVPAAIGSVLVLGHNPAVEVLLELMVGDPRTVPERFPTGAVADLRLPITSWAELRPHVAELGAFVVPRDLEGGG